MCNKSKGGKVTTMKRILTLCVLLAVNSKINAQQEKVKLEKDFSQMKAASIQLFKFDTANFCDQSKAVSIIYDNKVSKCFTYLKSYRIGKVKKMIKLLRDKTTYGNDEVACFDTEYGIVFYNSNGSIIGYINISFSCNELISNPIIPEREHFITEKSRKVGFSLDGRGRIIRLLGLFNSQ